MMLFIRAVYTAFLQILAISQLLAAQKACNPKKSQWGYTLEGSAYDSTPAENYPTCLTRCLTDTTRCKSVSYDLAAKTCELNIYSRWTKRLSYKPKTNSIYMEMVGVEEVFRNVTEPPTTPSTTQAVLLDKQSYYTSTIPTPRATVPTTAQPTTATAFMPSGDTFDTRSFCDSKPEGKYYHPDDCHKYVHCSYLVSYVISCQSGWGFNPNAYLGFGGCHPSFVCP